MFARISDDPIRIYHESTMIKLVISENNYIPPTIILLIGIWTSLTKNPMNPMIKNPIPVAFAIRANS